MSKRNYKREYKRYGSTSSAKKYRAALNKYNRKNGTYGNGDGMDAEHIGSRIKGFVRAAINRANNRPRKRNSV